MYRPVRRPLASMWVFTPEAPPEREAPQSSASAAVELTALPPEILHHIAWLYVLDMTSCNNVTSVLSTCQLFRDLLLPKLYSSVYVFSLDQLCCFLSPSSGSRKYCAEYTTDSIVINIPGVPGGGDGTLASSSGRGKQRSRDRLMLAAQALALCPRVRHVSLEFFSIRHSEVLTSEQFRQQEAEEFENALRSLTSLTTFRWIPPRREPSAIMGLSIVVVDQVIESLAKGLTGCKGLRTLELWNTMLPANGGIDLARTLIGIASARRDSAKSGASGSRQRLSLNLRSVTGLDPRVVSMIALAAPNIKINIADGFIGSIWGPRIDHEAISDTIQDVLDTLGLDGVTSLSTSSTPDASSREASPELQIQAALRRATDNVSIKVLKGGIAGSRYAGA